jgi:hypothetical protein
MKSGFSWIFAHLFRSQTRYGQNTGHFRAYGESIFLFMFSCQMEYQIIFLYANRRNCKTIFPC